MIPVESPEQQSFQRAQCMANTATQAACDRVQRNIPSIAMYGNRLAKDRRSVDVFAAQQRCVTAKEMPALCDCHQSVQNQPVVEFEQAYCADRDAFAGYRRQLNLFTIANGWIHARAAGPEADRGVLAQEPGDDFAVIGRMNVRGHQ